MRTSGRWLQAATTNPRAAAAGAPDPGGARQALRAERPHHPWPRVGRHPPSPQRLGAPARRRAAAQRPRPGGAGGGRARRTGPAGDPAGSRAAGQPPAGSRAAGQPPAARRGAPGRPGALVGVAGRPAGAAGHAARPDRGYVDYLDPGTAFLVRKGNPLRIRSRDDLCGRTVARPLTTPAEALLRQSQRCVARGRAKITLMTCPTIPDPRSPVRGQVLQRRCPTAPEPLRRVQELVRDRGADAAMLDLPLAQHAMTAPGAGRHLEIAPPQIDAGPYGIVFRKADRQLRDAVRSALQAIVADGTYARILAKWGLAGRALPPAAAGGGS